MSLIKNLTVAKKSLFYNFKRYLCFFVMLLLIQTLFASVLVLYTNNNSNQIEYLEANYNYHLQLQNLNDSQYYYLINIREAENSETFDVVYATKSQISGTARWRYDINIKFLDNVNSSYNNFIIAHYETLYEEGEFKEFVTPLLRYEIDYVKSTVICALTCFFIFISGCIIIYLIDSIMVNHYKFVYGIYMTFGANFKKLFVNSLFEMLLISIIVFIPSQVITNLVCFIILKSNMLTFRISILSIILSLLMSVSVAAIPVFLNIKTLSRKTPLKLIGTVDNGNHITSPRISSDFIGYSFPNSTELLSLKRFRKYVAKLLASTVPFAVAFVCCAYLGASYSEALDINKPQFNIVFNGYYSEIPDEEETENPSTSDEITDQKDENASRPGWLPDTSVDSKTESETKEESKKLYQYTYTDDAKEYFYSFDGIEIILKNCCTPAIDINSHVKISKSNVKLSGGAENSDSDRCFLNADFTVLDEEVIGILEYYNYEIEGDLSEVLSNSNMIAITDGYSNSNKFKLSVGDKIYISTDYEYFKTAPNYQTSDLDYIMALKLKACEYSYTEFTVGAIIRNSPVGSSFPVYMNSDTYKEITGNDVIFDEINIIMDPDISADKYEELKFNLRHAADYYSNMTLTNTDAKVLNEIEKNKKYESVFLFIAAMLLVVSPVIWLFSQILFYLKRRPEFDVYFSLGAPMQKIRKAFLFDGLVFTVVGSVAYILLCITATLGVTWFLNSQLYSASEYIRYSYSLPVLPFLIGLIVTMVSAFVSSYVPYIIYIRSCHEIFTGRFSENKNDIISEGETGV